MLSIVRRIALWLFVSGVFSSVAQAQTPSGVPVFEISQVESKIKFKVEASVAIEGTFDKWNAMLTFASTDVTTGILDVRIQAASVNTGTGLKNSKLKSKDFFDVEQNPVIQSRSFGYFLPWCGRPRDLILRRGARPLSGFAEMWDRQRWRPAAAGSGHRFPFGIFR